MRGICFSILGILCGIGLAASCHAEGENQLIVVGRAGTQPATWFETNKELAWLRNRSQYSLLTPDSKLFHERYALILGTNYPMVLYTRPDGGTIYAADARSLPATSKQLFEDIKAAALKAKNAVPATQTALQSEPEFQSAIEQLGRPDCPDGKCPVNPAQEDQLWRRPFARPPTNPFESSNNHGGWLSDSVQGAIWIIGGAVGLGFFLLFLLIALGVVYLIASSGRRYF